MKAECIFVGFLLCSLWDVKVYIVVSVDILGTVHVFYIWFVSVWECDCVAQLYHVGVYLFLFFFF